MTRAVSLEPDNRLWPNESKKKKRVAQERKKQVRALAEDELQLRFDEKNVVDPCRQQHGTERDTSTGAPGHTSLQY